MSQNPDTARTLRLIPRAAALELSSEDAPLRARWSGPTPRIRERGVLTEVGYSLQARLRALAARRSWLALTLDRRLRIAGGASRVTVRRPPGVPVSDEIDGGASGLAIDDERLGPLGGQVRAQAAGHGPAVRLRVAGGASELSVEGAPVRELAYVL